MGARKRLRAEERKEQRAEVSFAKLRNCPVSPRKMRLVADLVRGRDVNEALDLLHYNPKHASKYLEKLLKSAIANWKEKNEELRLEEADLYIKEIYVDGGSMLKRIQPAPQGRAHRIRKRSNHVTLVLGSLTEEFYEDEDEYIDETAENETDI